MCVLLFLDRCSFFAKASFSFRTIIICRFLLALRDIYYPENAEDKAEGNSVGSMHFRSRIVGSMGATLGTLNFGDVELNHEEEDNIETMYSSDPFAAALMDTARSSDGKHIEMETLQVV